MCYLKKAPLKMAMMIPANPKVAYLKAVILAFLWGALLKMWILLAAVKVRPLFQTALE